MARLAVALCLTGASAFVAPVAISVAIFMTNGALAAAGEASTAGPLDSCCSAPTRAVALLFSPPLHAAAAAHGWW